MSNDLISVIIPIYNSEKCIVSTVKSVLEQTYQNIEVVLVNDGSTDNSKQIIEDLLKYDKRIKIVNKPNGGVSSARNIGIKKSLGKYVTFIDADDKIEKDYLDILHFNIIQNSCDIVKCDYKYSNNQKKFCLKNIIIDSKNKSILEKEMFSSYKFNPVWGQLICKDLLKDITFDEELQMGEDFKFNYYLYRKAGKIQIISNQLYIYNINPEGITYNFSKSKIEIKIKNIVKLYDDIYYDSHNQIILSRFLNEIFPHIILLFKYKGGENFLNEYLYQANIYKKCETMNISQIKSKYKLGIVFLISKKIKLLKIYSRIIVLLKRIKVMIRNADK